jgi:glycosyltransferase involved in cell wall biosynthesis
MNEKIISIVIATYNMEDYLSKCLDSVLIKEVLEKIEIIVVNDGSTDNSLAIAKSYQTRFPESVIVVDKPNGHYGSCINAGLKIASGKYFRPLDPDDWFDSASFVQYVNNLQEKNVDMVITNFSQEDEKKISRVRLSNKDIKNIIPEEEYDFLNYDFVNKERIKWLMMHMITYRTQLLKEINFRCTEGISYTDTEYCFYPIEYVKTFIYLHIVLYKYFIGRDGQSMSESICANNKEHFYILISNMIEHLNSTRNNYKENIRKKQYVILKGILRYYYGIILCYTKRNSIDDDKLKGIDLLLKILDKNLYNEVEEFMCMRIKFVLLWRKKDIYFNEIGLFRLLNMIRNIIYRR